MTQPTPQPASPAPGVPQTGTKAIVSSIVSVLGTFVTGILAVIIGPGANAIGDIGGKEWITILLCALVSTAAAYGFTYNIPNKPL